LQEKERDTEKEYTLIKRDREVEGVRES
jgi:hypothetical protein